MNLIKQIQTDQLTARKCRDTIRANLLTTLLGEASMIGKNDGNRESTDLEVTQVIKKFSKNAQETLTIAESNSDPRAEYIKAELLILDDYLPKQMTEQELRSIIQNAIDLLPEKSPKQMGVVMKDLTSSYGGTYDGQLASKLVKELLN
jgi:uncharacterized protein YqeY